MKIRLRRLNQIVIISLAILGIRLFSLQIIRGERYARLSDRNRIRKIILTAPRGRIFDRNGIPLADTRPSWTIAVIPTETNDSALSFLSAILKIPMPELRRRLEPIAAFPSPVNICRDVSFKIVAQIEENNFRLPGVMTRVDPVRNYPYGPIYAHCIGYIGEITDAELARDTSYHRLDYIGKTGIEARYEKRLRGADGTQFVEVDVRGREIGPLPEKRVQSPISGNDIYLTINHRLQQLAYELSKPYERSAVVGIAIRTGEILCLISNPAFDPNLFLSHLNSARWDSLVSNPAKPFFNRVISAAYPPGSTFKPLIALLALEKQLITPQTNFIPCNGGFRYGNRTFRCWSAHGHLNLIEAIEQSCNSYFYQIGLRLNVDTLSKFCRRLKLDQPSYIDIPGEKIGNVPSREFLNRRYGKGKWTQGVMLNLAIGQGELTLTPLQLALLYACIANDGTYFQPYLVDRIESAGTVIYTANPKQVKVELNSSQLKIIKTALTRVVEYGTARGAQLPEISIAGKTGTAQNPPKPDHAWFVGYAPAEDPEVVFAVILENAGQGGAAAAPIVSALVRSYFLSKNSYAQD